MPKVSIIVPVYNVEQYLCECLDSILNQTYKDFELILVNDGSVDKSGKICDQYREKYNNIRVIHQTNQGQAVARNNGVKLSKAEWIMFVDSDDVIHQCLLEYLYKAVIESNSGMAVSERINSVKIPYDFYNEYEFKYDVDKVTTLKLEEYYDENKFFYWAPFPSIIKKEILVALPFPSGKIYEDNAVSSQFLYKAQKIAKVPFVMYYYRDNPNSTMNKPLTIKKLDYLWALEYQITFFESIEFDVMTKKISRNLMETSFYFYDISVKEDNKEIEIVLRRKIKTFLNKYKNHLNIDKKMKNKLLKIYHPFLYKVKKKLNF